MSELPQKQGAVACPHCNNPMKEVLRIAPVVHEQGLIAFECPSCGYVMSVLIPAGGGGSTGGRPR
jgi:uncharacterized Zn finger protein